MPYRYDTSNGEQDIVFIKDLRTELGTPRLARIINVDTDSQGTERYYDCQYKQRISGKFKTVRRPAQSLCLLLTAEEMNNKEGVTRDSLEFPAEIPKNISRTPQPKRIKVKVFNKGSPEIKDI